MEVGLVEMESFSVTLGLAVLLIEDADPFCKGGGGRLVGTACVWWLWVCWGCMEEAEL